jgi:hypothetical protein
MLAARYARIARGGRRVGASDIRPQSLGRYGQNDRAIAIGRKNYLFAGSDAGGRRAAAIYSLIESAKLNGLNPQHYLADLLAPSPITPPGASLNCCPGTGNQPTPPALPPEPAHSTSAYGYIASN